MRSPSSRTSRIGRTRIVARAATPSATAVTCGSATWIVSLPLRNRCPATVTGSFGTTVARSVTRSAYRALRGATSRSAIDVTGATRWAPRSVRSTGANRPPRKVCRTVRPVAVVPSPKRQVYVFETQPAWKVTRSGAAPWSRETATGQAACAAGASASVARATTTPLIATRAY